MSESDLKARIKEYEYLLNKHLSDNPEGVTLDDVLKNKDELSQYITDFNKKFPLRERYKKRF